MTIQTEGYRSMSEQHEMLTNVIRGSDGARRRCVTSALVAITSARRSGTGARVGTTILRDCGFRPGSHCDDSGRICPRRRPLRVVHTENLIRVWCRAGIVQAGRMIGLFCFVLTVPASPFKSASGQTIRASFRLTAKPGPSRNQPTPVQSLTLLLIKGNRAWRRTTPSQA